MLVARLTTREMRRATHKPGYWWVNVAPLGELPMWEEQPAPPQPSNLLFGYEPGAFLRKQYK